MELINLKYVTAAVVYSFLGLLILLISFIIVEKITPENIWKEVVQNRNTALAIVIVSFILAIAIIISSAIHG